LKLKKIKSETFECKDSDSKISLKIEERLEFNSDKHIKTEPTEENDSDIEQNQNIESKDRNPVKVESAKKLDILNPEDEE
jgi:hypothetical protein